LSILRIGSLVQDSSSLLHLFRRQIEAGGAMTVAHAQMSRNFALPAEVARGVLQSFAQSQTGSLLAIEAGTSVNIVDLATRFARAHGLRAVVQGAGHQRPLRPGDVAIRITGRRMGEAVNEARPVVGLAGDSSEPRIVALETPDMPLAEQGALFEKLSAVCAENDVLGLEQLLWAARIGYGADAEIRDIPEFAQMALAPRREGPVLLRDRSRTRTAVSG